MATIRRLCTAVASIALALLPWPVEAARGSAIAEGAVIVWDGSNDVSVSNGSGTTNTLAALQLASLNDYAVRAWVTGPNFDGINDIRVLITPDAAALATACAPASRPAFCAAVKRFADALVNADGSPKTPPLGFHTTTQNPPSGVALDDVKVVPIALVRASADQGIWRLSIAGRQLLAEMISILGAEKLHVGFDSNITAGVPGTTSQLEDMNLALPAGSQVAISSGPASARLACVAFNSTDTSELFSCADSNTGATVAPESEALTRGIFQSTDSGVTWSYTGTGITGRVVSIAVDPSLTSYAAAGTDIFQTQNGVAWTSGKRVANGNSFRQAVAVAVDSVAHIAYAAFESQLFKSSDFGTTWTEIPTVNAAIWPGRTIRTITVSPESTIFVDFVAGDPASPSHIVRSTDHGATWTVLPFPVGSTGPDMRVETTAPALFLYASRGAAVFLSKDQGLTWSTTTLTAPIAKNPFANETVFAAGQSVRRSTTTTGASATTVLDATATIDAIDYAPDGSYVLVRAAGRLYRSTDGGVTWVAGGTGLVHAPVRDLDLGNTNVVFAATSQTPAGKSTDGGRSWSPVADRHTAVQMDVLGSNVLAAFSLQGEPTLFKSIDSGASWTALGFPPVGVVLQGVNWAVFDPLTSGRLFESFDGKLFVSTNGGTTWSALRSDLAIAPPAFTSTSGTFYAVGADASGYGLWKTTNAGATWTKTSAPLTGSSTGYVAVRNDASFPLVAVAEGRRVYRSTDGGQSWTSQDVFATGTITALTVGTATTGPSPLIAGTDRGLYVNADDGRGWRVMLGTAPVGAPFSTVTAVQARGASAAAQRVYFGTDAGAWTFDQAAAAAGIVTVPPSGGYVMISFAGLPSSKVTMDTFAASWLSRATSTDTLTGDATLVLRVEADPTIQVPRTGLIDIGTRTFAVTQSPATCTYSLSPTDVSIPIAGATGSITITTGAACPWSAFASGSFVSITSAVSGIGSGTVSYAVAANTGPTSRSGAIVVAGQSVAFSQPTQPPTLQASRNGRDPLTGPLRFSATNGGIALATQSPNETLALLQSGFGTLQWVASADQPWVVVGPGAGTGSVSRFIVGVQFDPTLPVVGTRTATITVRNVVDQSVLTTIGVTLDMLQFGTTQPPTGTVDTPLEGQSGVTGSIAVTGWVVDDVGIASVKIYRALDVLQGEIATNRTFVGDAVLVAGARSDIEALNPTKPGSNRAGWGYLMLTNMLPNQGDGTFRFSAIATDLDGHQAFLGSRTITCTNSSGTKPFGAIDTPGQGETISGGFYDNFGWVLARGMRRADPPGGGAVNVVVDGTQVVGSPFGWVPRSDLTALFPKAQYDGIDHALGVFKLDTTTLTNGVHTIAWGVTDNNGGADGIGSRYFTVANGSSLMAAPVSSLHVSEEAPGQPPTSLLGRRGFNFDAPLREYRARNGVFTVQSEELDRIELHVGTAEGALRTAFGLAPLPIGSRLDPETGIFTWQPGVAFVGAYDFVFGAANVRIVLNPRGSGRVGPQVVIDRAEDGVIAGWAADLDAADGTGVDRVDVWAYPLVVSPQGVQRGQPLFVGTADYGGNRPDVGAIFGEQFRPSGYGARFDALPPGDYDLAVFAYSTVVRAFVPARTVRVHVP